MTVGPGVGVRIVSIGGFIAAVADGVGFRLGMGVGGGAWVAIGIAGVGGGMGVEVSTPSPPQATVTIMDAARMASGKKGFIGVVLVSASSIFSMLYQWASFVIPALLRFCRGLLILVTFG